ncbi:uncharacterized protein TNCV_3924201 [Trichonephila clavipes]|nr:uncharacterized protein TNCV_3924201 [Trichonephila clavipes]
MSVPKEAVPDRQATGRPGFDARCHQIPSECIRSTCSLNQWVRSLVGLFTSAGTGEYFPPLQFTCRNCGGGDRGRVAIYRPFGEVSLSLNRTVTCMVLKANDRRTSCPCHDEFRGPRTDYVRQISKVWFSDHTFVRYLKTQLDEPIIKEEEFKLYVYARCSTVTEGPNEVLYIDTLWVWFLTGSHQCFVSNGLSEGELAIVSEEFTQDGQ